MKALAIFSTLMIISFTVTTLAQVIPPCAEIEKAAQAISKLNGAQFISAGRFKLSNEKVGAVYQFRFTAYRNGGEEKVAEEIGTGEVSAVAKKDDSCIVTSVFYQESK